MQAVLEQTAFILSLIHISDRVFITHSECDAKTVEEVRDYIASLGVFKEIIETRAGGVISSHCGPGTLGVLFIAK